MLFLQKKAGAAALAAKYTWRYMFNLSQSLNHFQAFHLRYIMIQICGKTGI